MLCNNVEIKSLEEDYDFISQTNEHCETLNVNNDTNASTNTNSSGNSSNKSSIKAVIITKIQIHHSHCHQIIILKYQKRIC